MVYRLTSLRTLYLRFNRLAVVDPGIGNLRVRVTLVVNRFMNNKPSEQVDKHLDYGPSLPCLGFIN